MRMAEEQLDIRALKLGILMNFPYFVGQEKAKEAVNIVEKLESTIEAQQKYIIALEKQVDVEGQQKEIERLKSQNKLMFQALMCLPGAMGGTVHGVCRVCLRHECQECIIDKAIREAMGG
jgi:hypothetical protein